MAFEPDFNYMLKCMSPKERERFDKVMARLQRNKYSSTPIWPVLHWRWCIWKMLWLMREVRLLVESY